jgi:sialic acid synthase SpsE
VKQLDPLVPAFKIASGDNNYWPLIEAVAKTGKPILLSTGMADFNAIMQTRKHIETLWGREKTERDLAILHCVSLYPTPPEEANLLAIPFLKEKLGGTIGYSDHTLGIDAALIAITLGARIIEKHFTLDKKFSDFPDHPISMDPRDLRQLIKKIPMAVKMLGTYGVSLSSSQLESAKGGRRSIVASHDLSAGKTIEWNDLDWVRPGGGLSPGEESLVLEKTLQRDIPKGHLISLADLK